MASERDSWPGSPRRHSSMPCCHSGWSRRLTTGVCPIGGRCPRRFIIANAPSACRFTFGVTRHGARQLALARSSGPASQATSRGGLASPPPREAPGRLRGGRGFVLIDSGHPPRWRPRSAEPCRFRRRTAWRSCCRPGRPGAARAWRIRSSSLVAMKGRPQCADRPGHHHVEPPPRGVLVHGVEAGTLIPAVRARDARIPVYGDDPVSDARGLSVQPWRTAVALSHRETPLATRRTLRDEAWRVPSQAKPWRVPSQATEASCPPSPRHPIRSSPSRWGPGTRSRLSLFAPIPLALLISREQSHPEQNPNGLGTG
jgi:hypothetical protein